jgi:hypothetical protein
VHPDLQDADDLKFVLTPGGIRASDRVTQAFPDKLVRVPRRRARTPGDNLKGILLDKAARAEWIVATVCQGGPVEEFVADIIVPAEPTRRGGQLIYIFTGLQDEPTTMILQPVLQWGAPGDPGGWRLCSWLVDRQTNKAHATASVGVNPGARVRAYLRLIARNGGKFLYASGFDGFPTTTMNIETERALRTAVTVLEAYKIQGSPDYPPDPAIRFEDVTLSQTPAGAWFVQNFIIDGGQHAEIVSGVQPYVFELHCR